MTGRDRMVLVAVVVLAVLGASWVLVVSPERKQASKLSAQVSEAQNQLSSAEGQLANARQAQSQYDAAYAAIVSLGKAVPPSEEVPSLIYQLELASNRKNVDFSSIVTGAGSGPSSGSSASATAAAVAPTGFTQMPFTFVFNGTFFDLDHLFQQLTHFTRDSGAGALQVSGRLLTIQSVKLAPVTTGISSAATATTRLTGTITATAYVLPASQGLTGAAGLPAGSATAASSTGASSSATAPAIVRVNP
jgi:Tfp pilus assembly protein PilO